MGKIGHSKKLYWVVYLCLPFWALGQGIYSGGNGSHEDPFQIGDMNDLNQIRNHPEDWTSSFILMNDLDLDPNLPDREIYQESVIAPAIYRQGNSPQGTPFEGVFDGNNHSIHNLMIQGHDYLGFFGWVGYRGYIKNLIIENGQIEGYLCVGGIAGCNQGLIKSCRVDSTVTSKSVNHFDLYGTGGIVGCNRGTVAYCSSNCAIEGYDGVGGLVGVNDWGSIHCSYSTSAVIGKRSSGGLVGNNKGCIQDCYSEGLVISDQICGGIASETSGVIINCYSASEVTGVTTVGGIAAFENSDDGNISYIINSHAVGPLQGQPAGGIVGNKCPYPECRTITCFWNIETTGTEYNSGGGFGLTSDQMSDPEEFLLAGWDFSNELENGTCDNWYSPPGRQYPKLSFQHPQKATPIPFEGKGTEMKPYLIEKAEDLLFISGKSWLLDKSFRLVGDIDLSGKSFSRALIAPNINDDDGIESFVGLLFMGVFDGNGNTIKDVLMDNSQNDYVGLFGSVEAGLVKDLTVRRAKIYGKNTCGILAGRLGTRGMIQNCAAQGWIGGEYDIGGLVGYHRGNLLKCSFEGVVNGAYDRIGGLTGHNDHGLCEISESCVKGAVSGRKSVGGLTGFASSGPDSSIQSCYTKGVVAGSRYVGSLVGSNGGTYMHKDGWIIDGYGQDILNSYSHANVYSYDFMGGLVGEQRIAWEDAFQAETGLMNSYFAGKAIRRDEECAGLIGWLQYQGSRYEINGCFYDKEVIGASCLQLDELWGRTTRQMKTRDTYLYTSNDYYLAWDFENVWSICELTNYPRLQWQILPGDWTCPEGVDLEDFSSLAACWLKSDSPCTEMDVDGDSDVSGPELISLSEHWLSGVQEKKNLGLIHFDFESVADGTVASNVEGLIATLVNMELSAIQPGYIGNAIYFDGIDDYIELQGYKGIAGSAPRSVGAWIKTSAAGGQILSWGEPDAARKWTLRLDEVGRLRIEVGNGNRVGTSLVSDGQWHHVMVVLEPGQYYNVGDPANTTENCRLYVDGQLENVITTVTSDIETSTSDYVRIGAFLGNPVFFNGMIDEIKIFYYPVDKEEIRQMIPHKLVAHWKMNELQGSTIYDAVNEYDGSMINMSDTSWDLQESALYFDGADDFIEFSNFNGITGGKTRTCCAWIKTDTAGKTIMAWGLPDAAAKWRIRMNEEGLLRLEVEGGYRIGLTQIADNRWHHIAITLGYDDTWPGVRMRCVDLFVDGMREPLMEIDSSLIYTAAEEPVRLGHYRADDYYKGYMRDVRIYNYALPSDQIRELAGTEFENEFVGHWKLDEQQGMVAYDSVNNHNGVLVNMSETNWDSHEQALYFNGIDNYIEMPDYKGVTGRQTRSCCMWIKTGTPEKQILSWGNSAQGEKWVIRINEMGLLRIEVGNGYVVGISDIADNQWHHIVVKLDDSEDAISTEDIKLYVDGRPEAVGELVTQYINTASSETLKIAIFPGQQYFQGYIKDVRVYNYPISIDQIHELTGRNPAAYWKLDETQGLVAHDSVGDKDGALINMHGSSWYQGDGQKALSFDGIDDHVQITEFKGIHGTQSRTCAAWIKTITPGRQLLSWGTASPGGKWVLRVNETGAFRVEVSGGYKLSAQPIDDGIWTHVAVVLNTDDSPDVEDLVLYVNGAVSNGAWLPYPIDTAIGDDVKIGIYSTTGNYFQGSMRDVRLYDYALEKKEIEEIYNLTK